VLINKKKKEEKYIVCKLYIEYILK